MDGKKPDVKFMHQLRQVRRREARQQARHLAERAIAESRSAAPIKSHVSANSAAQAQSVRVREGLHG